MNALVRLAGRALWLIVDALPQTHHHLADMPAVVHGKAVWPTDPADAYPRLWRQRLMLPPCSIPGWAMLPPSPLNSYCTTLLPNLQNPGHISRAPSVCMLLQWKQMIQFQCSPICGIIVIRKDRPCLIGNNPCVTESSVLSILSYGTKWHKLAILVATEAGQFVPSNTWKR